jgi:hypothetical protein
MLCLFTPEREILCFVYVMPSEYLLVSEWNVCYHTIISHYVILYYIMAMKGL